MENFNHGLLAHTCGFPKDLPRSLIHVELRLEEGMLMISELRIASGPVGELTAPDTEEGSPDSQKDAGSCDKVPGFVHF